MKPYAFNVQLPGESVPKTLVSRAFTAVDAWHKIEKAHPGAKMLSVTWKGRGETA